MAQNEKQAKSIRDLIADQNKILQENLRIQAKQAGIDSDILSDQQDIANVLKDQIKSLKFQVSEKSLIRKITSDINKISEKGYSLGQEELGTAKGIEKLQKDRLGLEQKIRLIKQQQGKFSKMALTGDIKSRQLNSSIAESLGEQGDQAAKLSLQLGQIEDASIRIADSFGVKTFGALKDIANLIPGFSRFAGPFDDAAEAARATVTEMETTNMGIDKFKELREQGVGVQEALEQAGVSAKDVNTGKFTEAAMSAKGIDAGMDSIGKKIASFATVVIVFKELFKLLAASDKAAGELAKSMNVSYGQAQAMRKELRAQAMESDSIFVNTEKLSESMAAINQTLGTNVMLNAQDLETFTKLREQAGFTNEELMGIQAISSATGTSLEANTGEFIAQAQQAAVANGVLLNEKELLKDIGNVSAATTLSFGKNPGLIAQAVATAKSLGMELGKVEDIAGSLLDFESSIKNELEAELLTGKNLNLEKARQAALNNDLATVATEIAKQAGDSAEFAKMNRIQQDALAKSVGMSRDELAETLYTQEQLEGLTGDEAAKREKLMNNRIKEVGLAQAQKEFAADGFSTLEKQAAVSDRMAATMDKISDAFMSIADTILQIVDPIVTILEPALSGLATIIGYMVEGLKAMIIPLTVIGGIMYKNAIRAKAGAIMNVIKGAWSALGGLPVVGPALALATIAGAVGYVKSQKIQDGIAPSSKGPFTITDSYGAMATTTAGDSLMASPNVGKGGGGGDNKVMIAMANSMASIAKSTAASAKEQKKLKPIGLYNVSKS